MDILAIERRDERTVETIDDFVRHLIGFVFEALDRLDVRHAAIGRRFEQFPQMLDGFFVPIGDFSEQSEKLFFARQETHGFSMGVVDRKDSGRLE